ALDDRVRDERRAVDHLVDVGRRDAVPFGGVDQYRLDRARRVVRRRQRLRDRERAGGVVDEDEVGEGAADVGADAPHRPGNRSRGKMSTVAECCWASMPPSEKTIEPVTYFASSEARKTAGPAMSSGVPIRASGTFTPRLIRSSSGRPWVSIEPGTSVQTRTP